ncbi:MAG: hypothetical protein JXR70_17465 [Spirochaetales bacterium]|nr:hypothetical protein [Spirochaetales bacterium]
MPKRLKSQQFPPPPNKGGLASLGIENTIATLDENGKYALLEFDDKTIAGVSTLQSGWPANPISTVCSGVETNYIWGIRNRGFYGINPQTLKTSHIISSYDPNGMIRNAFPMGYEKQYFVLEVAGPYPSPSYAILCDLNTDSILSESREYYGYILPFEKDQFLLCEFTDKKKLKWQHLDNTFNKIKSNKLINKMNALQINVWPSARAYHLEKRRIFGVSSLLGKLVYYSIHWDDQMEEIKVEPLVLQLPKKANLSDRFIFSPCGQWLKTTISWQNSLLDFPELVIYKVNDIFPQGLSPPIYCGYTKKMSSGAFMQHDSWGPCYVEQDFDNKKLFVYKLNEGMQILASEAAGRLS